MSEWSDVGEFITGAGAIAAALTAIGVLVYAVVHFSVIRVEARIKDLIEDATEPLRRNGGSNVGDLPVRFDQMETRYTQMERRVERIERRQLRIYDEIVDDSDPS